jgi:hypothetical protein
MTMPTSPTRELQSVSHKINSSSIKKCILRFVASPNKKIEDRNSQE